MTEFQSVKQAVLQLKDTNAQLERDLQAAKQELAYLRKQALTKRNSATPVAKPTPKVEVELKRMQQEAHDARTATAHAARMHQISESKAAELAATLKQLTQVNATLEREREQARIEVGALQDERKALRAQLRDLREQVKANMTAKTDLEDERDARAGALGQLAAERKDLLAKAAQAEFKYKELKESLTSVKCKKGDVEKARADVEDRLRRTQDELRSSKERAKNAEQRHKDMADLIAALSRQKGEFEADCANLRQVVARHEDANRGWTEHKKYLETKVSKLEVLVRQLTQANDMDLSKDRTEAAERRYRLNNGARPEAVIQELEEQVAQLQQSNRAVARDRDELAGYADRIARNSVANVAIEGEAAALLESLASYRAEKAELEHERNVAKRQVERQKREMLELKQDNQRYSTQLERLKGTLLTLESRASPAARGRGSDASFLSGTPVFIPVSPQRQVFAEPPAEPPSVAAGGAPSPSPSPYPPASPPWDTPAAELLKQEDIQRQVLVDHERIAFRAVSCIAQDKMRRLLATPL